MMDMQPIVIVGTGLAGYTVAREFRKLDAETPLVLLTTDDGGYYSKPMLSNALAQGKTADSLLLSTAEQMAIQLKAEIQADTAVTGLNISAKSLRTSRGDQPYSKLILALGADPFRIPLQGSGADAVLTVNDRTDYARFRSAIAGKRRIVILGGGLIGCEFANDLVGADFSVSVIDLAPQPLGRLVPEEVGVAIRDALTHAGVDWHLGTSVTNVDRTDKGFDVRLKDGTALQADAVLSAIGLRSRVQLAKDAGLEINRGIVTDRMLATSAPDVYALGDCAEVDGLVLPFVMPIMHAARALARTVAGQPTPVSYPAMPVVVKTPSYPLVVSPPALGSEGEWAVERLADGIRARFVGADGALLGFALGGSAVAEKQALTKLLPATLS